MSLVDLRVDLPAYSRSLLLKVNVSTSILQIKEEIYRTCPGQPRPSGQRLIWRGRILTDNETVDDLWKSEPRVVHLAVHPSAWSSSPPEIPQVAVTTVSDGMAQPSLSPPPVPPRNEFTSRMEFTGVPQPAAPRPTLAFIAYKHQKALAALSPVIIAHNELENSPVAMQAARSTALHSLQKNGWSWPSILDEEFPIPSEGGLVYERTVIEGKSYLRLCNFSESATPIQAHALKILSVTFTILSMTLPASSNSRSVQTQTMPIPPHVNQLLQQLGLPPLRMAQNQNGNPIPNIPILPEIREINLRPLLGPVMMLVFRTTLLMYFVSPTRKPIFGLLILAWMLYEIWQPIRNALRNGLGHNPQVNADNNRPDARPQNPVEPNGNNDAQAAAPQPAAIGNANANAAAPVTLDAQANVIFDTLANINIQEEEGMLREPSGVPPVEPGFGHKMGTFFALLTTTLHPAIWNRRRIALRRREGTIRTEAKKRNSVPAEEGETEAVGRIREELRAQFNRRPGWIQRYIERVVAEDWVDDSE